MLDLIGFDALLAGADLVLTCEGEIDYQTAAGKAPAAVAARSRRAGVPCIAIAGGLGDRYGDLHAVGIDALFSLCPGPIGLEEAQAQVRPLLSASAEQVVRAFLVGRNAGHPGRSSSKPGA